jgi:uncharacterized protein involved in tellurium resistance
MTDEVLRPGQNARLQLLRQEDVRVRLSVTGAAPLRLIGVMLDEHGRAINPAPLLTWRTASDAIQISLSQGETISAILHTAAIREPIQSIMFLVAPYGREFFRPNERLFTAVVSDGTDAMAIESAAPDVEMQTIALCEFYHHPEQGAKVRARCEWRHRELTTLLERLGVPIKVITDQMLYPLPQARHGDAERSGFKDSLVSNLAKPTEPAPPPEQHVAPKMNPALDEAQPETAPAPQPTAMPVDQPPPAISLKEVGAQQRLSATNAKFGPVQFRFSWHQRLATRAAVKIDVGCFWELQDDQKGQINRSTHQLGTLSAPPYIALDRDLHNAGSLYEETLRINGDDWAKIRRVLFYASIIEGNSPWDALDTEIKLIMPDQPPITADHITGNKSGPVTPLLLLENRSDQLRISLPGGCYDSHVSLDSAFDFQLGWQNEHERKPGAHFNTPHEITWQPAPPRGVLPLISHVCFGSHTYRQAEEVMRATLAASALVLIANGRVSMDDRRHAIDAIMRLPVGRYFSEFEVRNNLDKILYDLKHQRKAAEALAIRILVGMQGRSDIKIIIYAMRQIAMLDGQVTIQEERMVERLTRYLRPGNGTQRDAA